jgi:thiosulfate dehydrogenase
MGKFFLGLVIGIVAVPVAILVYLLSGRAPAAVNDPPFPMEQVLAEAALGGKIRREAPRRDLSTFTTADIDAGAEPYRRACAGCHGVPDQTETRPRPKMFPSPPQLFTQDGYVTDDPIGDTYWKIKNGIRLTAMPSFQDILTDQQMWQIAALLGSADKLPPEALETLKKPLFPIPPPPASGSPGAAAATGGASPANSTSAPAAPEPKAANAPSGAGAPAPDK